MASLRIRMGYVLIESTVSMLLARLGLRSSVVCVYHWKGGSDLRVPAASLKSQNREAGRCVQCAAAHT